MLKFFSFPKIEILFYTIQKYGDNELRGFNKEQSQKETEREGRKPQIPWSFAIRLGTSARMDGLIICDDMPQCSNYNISDSHSTKARRASHAAKPLFLQSN